MQQEKAKRKKATNEIFALRPFGYSFVAGKVSSRSPSGNVRPREAQNLRSCITTLESARSSLRRPNGGGFFSNALTRNAALLLLFIAPPRRTSERHFPAN